MSRVLIFFLLVLATASCLQAARKIEFNVDLFCGWDGYYRPMEWTPAEIGISTDLTEPFEGSFTLSAQQDGLNTLNVMHTFVLTPDVPLNLPLATKFAFGIGKCGLTIRDQRGRTRWEHSVDLYDYSQANRLLRVVQEEDLLVGLMGRVQFGLLRLPRDSVSVSERGTGKVFMGSKVPRMAPWDWTGFMSLDILILYDPDWALLRPEQVKAIGQWVSNGGTLLLVLGQHPLPQDSPLNDVIPFQLGEPRQVAVPVDVLETWGLAANQPEDVMAWPLLPKANALLTSTIQAPDAGCLHGIGYVGFGRVAVLGFDPSLLSDEQTRHTAAFWTTQIAACLEERADASTSDIPLGQGLQRVEARHGRSITLTEQAPADGNQRNDNRYRISLAQSASNQVMDHLYQLRQMRPLSIWWVILILSALAILLGPVDYFVLKRLDKLPYTWLTSTGWIVIFTVGAYYGVQELRGGKMQLRAVSVLDGVADSNHAWATYYTGLFAPRSDDYRLEGLQASQWWSGIAPNREEIYVFQREAGMRQIHCLQQDGANLPLSLPINIWTVQSLLGESSLENMPFAARVERRDDTVVVEITNTSDRGIMGGFVLLEDAYVDFGPIAAHATQTLERPPLPFNPWGDGLHYGQFARLPFRRRSGLNMPRYPSNWGLQAQQVFLAQGCLKRTMTMHACLPLGAAVVCAVFTDAPAPFGVKNRSYDVNHVQYARLLVLPQGT